jgi:yecA family protein
MKSNFKIQPYLKAFKDPRLSEQLESPYYILGLILAVASAPDLIKVSEWFPLIAKDIEKEIKFESPADSKAFIDELITWWNYCNQRLSESKNVELPSNMNFAEDGQPSHQLTEFCEGYINGYDWLEDLWDECVDESSETSALIGVAHVMIIQIIKWPEPIEGIDDLPDVIGSLLESEKRVVSFFSETLSAIGIDGHRIAQGNHFEKIPHSGVDFDIDLKPDNPCPCGSGKPFKKCCLH